MFCINCLVSIVCGIRIRFDQGIIPLLAYGRGEVYPFFEADEVDNSATLKQMFIVIREKKMSNTSNFSSCQIFPCLWFSIVLNSSFFFCNFPCVFLKLNLETSHQVNGWTYVSLWYEIKISFQTMSSYILYVFISCKYHVWTFHTQHRE